MKNVQDIVDLASAYYGSAVLFAAIDVDLFARLAKGERIEGRGMTLLADACVAEGLLEKRDGAYFNTPAAEAALVPGGRADLTKAIRYNRDVYPAWGRLAEFARTGSPVERPEIHLGDDAARTKAFAASMFGRAMGIGRGIVPMLGKLEGKLLDLAGGPGAYAILTCQANPALRAVTVDLKAISAEAAGYVAKFGMANRIEAAFWADPAMIKEEAKRKLIDMAQVLHDTRSRHWEDGAEKIALETGRRILIETAKEERARPVTMGAKRKLAFEDVAQGAASVPDAQIEGGEAVPAAQVEESDDILSRFGELVRR